MRALVLAVLLASCTPAFVAVGHAPMGAVVMADAESRARWNVEADVALTTEVNKCLAWHKQRGLTVDRFWPHVHIQVRTFDTAEDAGIYHAQLATPELMRINWLRSEGPEVVGRLACHEMGHLMLGREHEVMRAMGYPW